MLARDMLLPALLVVFAARICLLPTSLPANDTPNHTPHLVIESGYHRSIIRELIFTSDSQKLISVGDDKTIRIWNIATDDGQASLERVLRGPIGPGRVGAIYAAALCPPDFQGRHQWLAVAGYFSDNPEFKGAIRVHDFETGEIVALLQGHRNLVNALAVSPNGRWLASGSKDATIMIWDMASLFKSGRLPVPQVLEDHSGSVYDLAWSISGRRLASASYDRTVGLWDTSEIQYKGAHLKKKLEGHSAGVRSVAFHPNGQVLASGGKDRTIRLWDVKEGKIIKAVETDLNIAALAFSEDTLISGNTDILSSDRRVAVYEFPSLERRGVLPYHDNSVVATAFDPSGRIAASGGGDTKPILIWNPKSLKELTRLQGGGKTVVSVGFSKDGRYLYWGWTRDYQGNNMRGPLEHAFDLEELQLILHKAGPAVRARESIKSISLVGERRGVNEYLNALHINRVVGAAKKKLTTIVKNKENGYQHSAYTLTPDHRFLITGGLNGKLELYTIEGQLQASLVGHEGEIKAVAVSSDGKWAVSGAFDQTLRLWRLDNLGTGVVRTIEPTLSLFPGVDGNWVAWTPEGYYACSPKGFHLIGYVINKGAKNLAQYVSVGQLIEPFYRKDIVWAKIHGGAEELLKSERARMNAREVLTDVQPAQLRILEPPDNHFVSACEVKVKAQIIAQNGSVKEVLWMVNDRIIQIEKIETNITRKPKALEQVITLEPGSNTITVVARSSRYNVDSQPANINVNCTAEPLEKRKLCILAIGINDYRHSSVEDLHYAVSDAEDVMNRVRKIGTPLYTPFPQKLFNEDANFAKIENIFKNIADNLNANDIFVLYLAGHGMTREDKFYFLAHDFEQAGPNQISNAISKEDLREWLVGIKVLKSLVLIDACQSGGYLLIPKLRKKAEETAVDKLGRFITRHVIVSSSHTQVALEGYHNHGVFTHSLLEALQQGGVPYDDRYREVKVYEVASYVEAEVPKITRRVFNRMQKPYSSLVGNNFPLGRVPLKP